MVNKDGLPILPTKAQFGIDWTPSGATAVCQFTAERHSPLGILSGSFISTADSSALTEEEQASLYDLLAKLFESEQSQAMLRTDEWVAAHPPLVEEEAPAE